LAGQWELRDGYVMTTVLFSFLNHSHLSISTGLLLIIHPLIFIARLGVSRKKNTTQKWSLVD
jgi:hypothetical protein